MTKIYSTVKLASLLTFGAGHGAPASPSAATLLRVSAVLAETLSAAIALNQSKLDQHKKEAVRHNLFAHSHQQRINRVNEAASFEVSEAPRCV